MIRVFDRVFLNISHAIWGVSVFLKNFLKMMSAYSYQFCFPSKLTRRKAIYFILHNQQYEGF